MHNGLPIWYFTDSDLAVEYVDDILFKSLSKEHVRHGKKLKTKVVWKIKYLLKIPWEQGQLMYASTNKHDYVAGFSMIG